MTPDGTPPRRRPFQGLAQIVRFNWPMYVFAAIAGTIGLVGIALLPMPPWARVALCLATAIGLFWAIASLVVSFWIYDVSSLCKWTWVPGVLTEQPTHWLNIHCGFDESTASLAALFPQSKGRPLDIFDAAEMTEPSILRARTIRTGQPPAEPADYRRLPAANASHDAAFLILAAHELRSPDARATLFRELYRVIRPGGQIVVAEHLRDPTNFIAFGPGFLHFHSRASWQATFTDSGLFVERAFRITPFVAVFILRRPA
ncbi:MAG: class I SAM-dependent methyltransferase [Tepidisphaeraceae bacterium]